MPEAKLDVIVDPSGAITGSSQAKQAINSINESSKKMTSELERMREAQEKVNAATQKMVGAIRAAGTGWLVYKGIMNTYLKNSMEAEKAETQLNAVLKSTGHAAGLTANEIKSLASEMQNLTAFGDDEVLSMQNVLLTFKNIKGDQFKDATMAVLDLSTAMDIDLKSAALQVGKALNDPKVGLTALQRAGITFSDSQKQVIKKLQETGRYAEAQRLIIKELESQFGGSAEKATKNFGGALSQLKNKFGDLFEINATGEFGEMTLAVNALKDALDEVPVKIFTQELGKMVADGITLATDGLRLMAQNIDAVKDALGALMAMKVGSWFGGLHGALIGGAGYVLGKGAYDFIKKDQEQAKIAMKYIGGYSMTSSAGESYGGMFAEEKAALLGEKVKAPGVSTGYSAGGSATGKSGGKTAAEEALERIKKKAQEAGEAVAAALSRLEAQNTALEEAKSAATEGEQRYYDSLRWENQEGLLGDSEYLDILKKRFADLSTELEGLGLDMQNVSNWSEPMRATFSEIQGVVGDLASGPMDLLQKQFEAGAISSEQYRLGLENIKQQYQQYPAVVKSVDDAIKALNDSILASTRTLGSFIREAETALRDKLVGIPDELSGAFAGAIAYSEDLGESLKQLAKEIAYTTLKAFILKSIFGGLGGLGGSVGTPASAVGLDNWVGAKSIFGRGGVFDSGQLTAFASGGIVNKPTLFPFASGVGLMGEAGPEAIMPLKRTSSGDLGVKAEGGGGMTNITMNINAVDSRSFVEMMRQNRASVESIVVENIMRNGAVRGAIRGMT